jgi:hypothetical protein
MPPRKSFPLRLSPDLYEEIRRWAAQEFRSVNGQIEFLLRDAVRRRGRSAAAPDEASGSGEGDPGPEPR